jgi:uncharacterized protein (TIGR03435 family)
MNALPGGRFVATNVSLQVLISAAYGDPAPLPQNRLVLPASWIGGGDYLASEHFDIQAKAPADLAPDQIAPALRQLLADRFTLVVHHETRELPVYALVVDRSDGRLGPRLHKSDIDCTDPSQFAARNADGTLKCGFQSSSAGRVKGRHTLSVLTRLFSSVVADHRPVEDRTGLRGTFDIELEWSPEFPAPLDAPLAPPTNADAPSLFTAVREQLGLKLESTKLPVDVLVIDHAEKPTPD